MKRYFILLTVILLAGCGVNNSQETPPMAGGGDSGMMSRHHAQVPEEYAGLSAPEATDESVLRGADIYTTNCASCHGESGLGDGAAGAALTPRPSPIGHTTQMLADDLVFYRIAEGGLSFATSMPAWKGILTDEQIWDVIAYVRAMGQGNTAQIDQVQAAQQETMLNDALDKNVITKEQADTFRVVHTALENYMKTDTSQGTTSERESAALMALVESGKLTQSQVNEFNAVHALLSAGGFMP